MVMKTLRDHGRQRWKGATMAVKWSLSVLWVDVADSGFLGFLLSV